MSYKPIRIPDEYREPISGRKAKKWEKIISLFMENRLDDLALNPDLFLGDGTWVEVTLSQKTAYQKIFRYGHQADKLLVLWLDKDDGYHKEICQNVHFPNVEINSIECFNTQLEKLSNGPEIIRRLETLKKLKGIIL